MADVTEFVPRRWKQLEQIAARRGVKPEDVLREHVDALAKEHGIEVTTEDDEI